jgi:hypothetical protein
LAIKNLKAELDEPQPARRRRRRRRRRRHYHTPAHSLSLKQASCEKRLPSVFGLIKPNVIV